MKAVEWRFFRMRPSNFPTVRIAQLAKIYHEQGRWLPWLLEASLEELEEILRVQPSIYWQKHYLFNKPSDKVYTTVGEQQFRKLLINVVIPFRFAMARQSGNEQMQLKALDILSELPPEQNKIIRLWKEKGIKARTALDSQALIELKSNWCDERKCLQCAFGNYFLKTKNDYDKVEEAFVTLLPR
jgi:hypothetical protein